MNTCRAGVDTRRIRLRAPAPYATGRGGLPRNDREAVRLWMRAAEQEDAQAQNNLGRMYAEGRGGLPRDTQEAARMWRLAADQGGTEARNNLRKMGAGR